MRCVTADHYFSAEPVGPVRPRQIDIDVAGRRLRMESAAGVFSAGRLDLGTALLLRKAPLPGPDTDGPLLDLGCGYGPIAVTLALAAPAATVYAVDVNRRALDLTRANAESTGATNVVAAEPDQIPADLRFAQIWSNPPIRIGKAELHTLLSTWLPRLAVDGVAWLVVARQLGADSLHEWLTAQGHPVRRHASGKGYRVLAVGPHNH
jgi:16S rRNA (guanine1207-N2)-methyltransferase